MMMATAAAEKYDTQSGRQMDVPMARNNYYRREYSEEWIKLQTNMNHNNKTAKRDRFRML